jgi:hypothetical protein
MHRPNGPARISSDGTQEWYIDGRRHRLDGPAVIHADGSEEWRVHGELHRLSGSAGVFVSGQGHLWWVVNGQDITPAVSAWMQDNAITWPWDPETAALFALTWG